LSKAKYPKLFTIAYVLMLTLTASLLCNLPIFNASAQTTPTITVGNGIGYVNSTSVTLTVSSTGATQMQFSNDGSTWSDWEPYLTTKNWALTDGDGAKTVYAQFKDSANTTSTGYTQVTLDTVSPIPYPYLEWVSIVDRTIYFDGGDSLDDSPIRFLWDFGDGNQTAGVVVYHTYAAIGNYIAYLTVTDIAGNSATTDFSIKIPDPNSFPTKTPTPAPTQNPTATPTTTPVHTVQPSTGPGLILSTVALVLLGGVVLLVIIVVLLVFLMKRNRRTIPKPN
jgi:hypothetical protein